MAQLHIYRENEVTPLIATRGGETKLGETIGLSAGDDLAAALKASSATFVVLGLPEDIGVRANNGIGGAHTAWHSFLKSFLNIQHTDACRGTDFLLLGDIDFTDWMVDCADA
ncbi:MAG TPA: arginase, partial [Chitinophagaceae bacterium]|nr:arginase [Chitinophagaceae bacterium]